MIKTSIFNITDFGAVPDGRTLCSAAFGSAINACEAAGGGTVYIPSGLFLTGPLQMKNNVSLYLDSGAQVIFCRDKDQYPVIDSRWEGSECQVHMPQIYGSKLENVTISGRGVLDGQGDYWWRLYRNKQLEYPRPRMIGFEDCSHVTIEGIQLRNSPSWTVNPIRCQNIAINRVTIVNPADSPNTDGINPDSCKNVFISNCYLDVGDDCITLKSGIETIPNKVSCENIMIMNCKMVHGHGGVVIGSEMSGDVRDVVISNCVFEGTERGIRIKSRRGRGGIVENIRVNNIVMKDVICPFVLHMYYQCGENNNDKMIWDKESYPVTDETPIFRRIHFSNITAREVSAAAGFIFGLPEMPVSEVTFDNISISMSENADPGLPASMRYLEPTKQEGFFCCNTRNISFNQMHIDGNKGPAFMIQRAENIEFTRCSAEIGSSTQPLIMLEQVNEVLIHGCKNDQEAAIFLELKGPETKRIELIGNGGAIRTEQVRLTDGAQKDAFNICS